MVLVIHHKKDLLGAGFKLQPFSELNIKASAQKFSFSG